MDPITHALLGSIALALWSRSSSSSEKKDAENQNGQNNYPNNDYRSFNEAALNGWTRQSSNMGDF